MSFILDALKKSEAERRQGDVPRLQNETTPPKPRRRSFWLPVLTLALLFNGAVLGWWLLSRDGRPLPVEKGAGADVSVPAVAKAVVPETAKRPVPPERAVSRSVAAPPAVSSKTAERSVSLPAASAPGGVPIPETSPAPPKPAPLTMASPVAAPAVLGPTSPRAPSSPAFPPLSELAADVRSALPGLSLQLHFYSPVAENRLVRINGVNLREGSKSAGGLSVVEIVPDGVNLSCAGVRFFLPTARR